MGLTSKIFSFHGFKFIPEEMELKVGGYTFQKLKVDPILEQIPYLTKHLAIPGKSYICQPLSKTKKNICPNIDI